MRLKALCVVLAAGLLLAADDPKKEAEKFAGTWGVVAAERDGKPNDEIKNDKLIIAGDKITIKTARGDEDATFTVDPAKKPKSIDVKPSKENVTIQGIYEIEGDNLKICFAGPGGERPADFTTKAGSKRMLITLKREKK